MVGRKGEGVSSDDTLLLCNKIFLCATLVLEECFEGIIPFLKKTPVIQTGVFNHYLFLNGFNANQIRVPALTIWGTASDNDGIAFLYQTTFFCDLFCEVE